MEVRSHLQRISLSQGVSLRFGIARSIGYLRYSITFEVQVQASPKEIEVAYPAVLYYRSLLRWPSSLNEGWRRKNTTLGSYLRYQSRDVF